MDIKVEPISNELSIAHAVKKVYNITKLVHFCAML